MKCGSHTQEFLEDHSEGKHNSTGCALQMVQTKQVIRQDKGKAVSAWTQFKVVQMQSSVCAYSV